MGDAAKAITAPTEKRGILYVLCGTPGSGKSSFINLLRKDDEVVISRDNVRFEMLSDGEDYFSHEDEVYRHFIYQILKYINKGVNVYADATHLTPGSRTKLLTTLAKNYCFPREINAIYFDVPLDICLERNETRQGTKTYVPRGQVRRMFFQFKRPEPKEGFNNIWRVDKDRKVIKVK